MTWHPPERAGSRWPLARPGLGRMGSNFADKVLSAMRYQLGGHEEKKA